MRVLRRWSTWVVMLAAAGLTSAFAFHRPEPLPPREIMVWKSPTCGCCGKWVEYMKAQGYKVTVHDMEDVSPVKKQHSVPQDLWSCHTAVVDGYTIEGHVPAADIARLLREKPAGVTGLSVPGMVAGSPGMEGGRSDQYDVVAFGGGKTSVFAHH